MLILWLVDHDNDIYHYTFQVEDDKKIGNVLFSKQREAYKFTDDVINDYPDSYCSRIVRVLFEMYHDNNFLPKKVIAWY